MQATRCYSNPARFVLIMAVLSLSLATTAPAGEPIPGIGPIGELRAVHGGFQFIEGPAYDGHGNLYFSELREEKVYRVDAEGTLSVFLEQSGRTNGLMFDAQGRMIACESGAGSVTGVAQLVAIDMDTKARSVVAAGYGGKPFNRVNDLVIDREGGVYFTDIIGDEPGLPQEKPAVYYVAADGKVTRLINDLKRPNGVLLSPDEKTLYVLPAGEHRVMQYTITSPGTIGAGRPLSSLPYPPNTEPRGGDGLTVDSKGNLYVTVPAMNAIQVVSADGKVLGMIDVPERAANCTFGGPDMKTLFITASTTLYAAKMEVPGHRFASGSK